MIIVTGAAGFIGSQVALNLANTTNEELCLVDKIELFKERPYFKTFFEDPKSLARPFQMVNASPDFLEDLHKYQDASLVIHLGAITNTAEQDWTELQKWNIHYTQVLWDFCRQNNIPFIYASSAATYGNGENGFTDSVDVIPKLKPMNLYGQSKQDFDVWALEQKQAPPHWHGLKFFNVYGPNEDHKGRMASAIWHGYNEIKKTGQMTLFKSHRADVKDGDQARDFIYVGDILKVIDFLRIKKPASGIYNLGSGVAGTFKQLSTELFKALKKDPKIQWIETPAQFRNAYQYRTEADMTKLRSAGFTTPFTSLAKGIELYLSRY